jgi:signal transduction histidine kinase
MEKLFLKTNKDALVRVLDNVLSNAGKYNRANGKVFISIKEGVLSVEDTGKGIQHPSMVFERYYKEQDRGIGIGLHIVKKLCDELHIAIRVKSKEGEGTTIRLYLNKWVVS